MERAIESMKSEQQCLSRSLTAVYEILAALDGLITVVALMQLLRLHAHNPRAGWTRQKVFHCMIFISNFGYAFYFVINPLAACGGWPCWPDACGFILIAAPQIVFLATFLLLLSFWVDLCHQATDEEDEEDDEEEEEDDDDDDEEEYSILPGSPYVKLSSVEKQRRCCGCFRRLRVRGRQKFVMGAVVLICALTAAFAVLIWVGMGNNDIDSVTMAEAYSYIYAIVVLLSGGGLAAYGLLLYTKMCRLRSGKASADIRKVAGLAVVSVVCFSLRALLVLFSDIPVINIWQSPQTKNHLAPILTFLYYFIGESIPSVVVLWVMREMPPRSRVNSICRRKKVENEFEEALVAEETLLQQWVLPAMVGETYVVLPYPVNGNGSARSLEAGKQVAVVSDGFRYS